MFLDNQLHLYKGALQGMSTSFYGYSLYWLIATESKRPVDSTPRVGLLSINHDIIIWMYHHAWSCIVGSSEVWKSIFEARCMSTVNSIELGWSITMWHILTYANNRKTVDI